MIYANTTMGEVSPCCEVKEVKEVKEPGIYEQTRETRQILTEVLFMLDQFKSEIRDYKIPENERAADPACFRDDVACINRLSFAIRGDLTRLIDEFH